MKNNSTRRVSVKNRSSSDPSQRSIEDSLQIQIERGKKSRESKLVEKREIKMNNTQMEDLKKFIQETAEKTENKIMKKMVEYDEKIDRLKYEIKARDKRIEVLEEKIEFIAQGRNMNLIFHGVPEELDEDLILKVQQLVKDSSGLSIQISSAYRIGKIEGKKPIVFKIEDSKLRLKVLMANKGLYKINKEDGSKYFISRDLMRSEQDQQRKLKTHLKEILSKNKRAKGYFRGNHIIVDSIKYQLDSADQIVEILPPNQMET
jgi:hypothetical protein